MPLCMSAIFHSEKFLKCMYNARKEMHQNVAIAFRWHYWRILLFTFYTFFTKNTYPFSSFCFYHWKLFLCAPQNLFCFFKSWMYIIIYQFLYRLHRAHHHLFSEKGRLVLSGTLHGLSWGTKNPSSSLRHLSPLELKEKSAVGEAMSLKPSHSYPLTWEEICRRLLGAFATLQIVLKSIRCFFFFFSRIVCILLC